MIVTDRTKHSEDKNLKDVVSTFHLLYALTLLQIYNGEPDAIATIEDLESSFDAITQRQEIDSRTVIVLIEIILSSLSRSLTLYRIVAMRCFTTLSYVLTEDAMMSLFNILDKTENVIGQGDLYEKEESVEDLDSDVSVTEAAEEGSSDIESSFRATSEDMDEEGKRERITLENEHPERVDDEDEVVDESSDAEIIFSSDQESDEKDEELSKFNLLLADVLQVQIKEKAGEEDESSNESDMDDGQMMALESHLINIFKERKKIASKKREQKDAKEMMIAFKNRVLDLLLVYIRNQHAEPLSTALILPLLRLIRTTSSKQLAEKAFNHLKQYYDTCKSKGMPTDTNDETLWETLKNVHLEAMRSTNKMTASACSRSSLFVAKILISKDSKNYDKILEQYALTQKDWYMDPKSKINPTIFTEWISWSIGTRLRK